MVFKDPVGSRQAQIELAIKEKQILYSLQNSAPNKIIAPATSSSVDDLPIMAKPYLSKPQDWHCLKKLLEETVDEGCMIPNCQGTSLCQCAQDNYELALSQYIAEKYMEYDKMIEAKMVQLKASNAKDLAEIISQEDEQFSTDTEDTEDSSEDSDEDDTKINQLIDSV